MKTPSDPVPQLPGFLEARRTQMAYGLGFGHWQGDFAAWRTTLANLWHANLPPMAGLPDAQASGSIVTLTFATGAVAQGIFYLPPGPGPHPAVLLLHDHGGEFTKGWRKMTAAGGESPAPHYCGVAPFDMLADAGFAVLCMDALGWGARQTGGYGAQQALAANAMHLGWSLAGLVAAEDVQAAAWLSAHPAIDPRRVGAFGFSYGGFRSWQVAALSPHIAAAASISWLARRAELMSADAPLLRGQSAFYMLHPALGGMADFPDMAGLAAGKTLMFLSGLEDRHMPVGAVQNGWDDLGRICAAARAPLHDSGFFPGGHICDGGVQAEAADFLSAALQR